jgi:hypothetical protein
MHPTFVRHVQKVVCYLSGIMIIKFIVVENNGGQKVCIAAWQVSAFNLSLNRCPHSELPPYSTNLSSETCLVICHFLYNSHFVHLHYCLFQPLMMLIWVKRFWLHCGEKSKVGLMVLHSLVSIRVPFQQLCNEHSSPRTRGDWTFKKAWSMQLTIF